MQNGLRHSVPGWIRWAHRCHHPGDEAVHEEEDEGVEENGHLGGLSVHELDIFALGSQKNAGAERQKKGGWDRNFLGSDIWEHGYYTVRLFCLLCSNANLTQ